MEKVWERSCNIVVDEAYLLTAVGEDARAVYANVATAFRNDEMVEVYQRGYGENDTVMLRTCPIPVPHRSGLAAVIPEFLARVFVDIERQIARDHAAGKRTRLHLVSPPPNAVRKPVLDPHDWLGWLRRLSGELEKVECTIGDSLSATADLIDCCTGLYSGDHEAVYFGGIDSLVWKPTYQELFDQGRIPKDPAAGVVSPGEGVAFVRLHREEKVEPGAVMLDGAAAVEIGGDSVAGRADALARSMELVASASAGDDARPVAEVIHDLQGEQDRVQEWLLASDRVWPNRLPEHLRQAVQDGAIERADNPEEVTVNVVEVSDSLGCLGAVSLPVSLAIGYGKLRSAGVYRDFGCPLATELLVIDASSDSSRGVVSLALAAESTSAEAA